MEKCLVTKLKAAADNAELLKIKEFKLTVKGEGFSTFGVTVRSLKDSVVTQGSGTTSGYYYATPGTIAVAINDNGRLFLINSSSTVFIVEDLHLLKFYKQSEVHISTADIRTCNLADIAESGATIIELANVSMNGSVDDLIGVSVDITKISLINSRLNGELAHLFDALAGKGKTGSLIFRTGGGQTLNGTILNNGVGLTVNFDGGTWSVEGQ